MIEIIVFAVLVFLEKPIAGIPCEPGISHLTRTGLLRHTAKDKMKVSLSGNQIRFGGLAGSLLPKGCG